MGDGRRRLLSVRGVYLPSSTQERDRSPVSMRPWHGDNEESRKQSAQGGPGMEAAGSQSHGRHCAVEWPQQRTQSQGSLP